MATTQALPATLPVPAKQTRASDEKADKPKIHFYGLYRFRVEDWNWFPTPKANGAYTFETSVLKLGVTSSTRLNDFTLEFEQPTILNVPHDASGSGAIGNLGYGASYYVANHNQGAGVAGDSVVRLSAASGPAPSAATSIG